MPQPIKKLLVIAPQNPYPATDGGKIGIYLPIVHLSKFFSIHFAFVTDKPVSTQQAEHFKSLGIKIYPQLLRTKDSAAGYLVNTLQVLPYKFKKYCNRRILKNLETIVTEEGIEAIWCNHAHVAWYGLLLKSKYKMPVYLREHNIEYSLVEQVMNIQSNPLTRLFIKNQYQKTKKFEMFCWKKFNRTFFISDSDIQQAKNELNSPTFSLVYDSFQHFNSFDHVEKEPFSFIFTGNLDTFQNRFNLQKFIDEIWIPLVAKDKRWKLYITGNSNSAVEKHLKTDKSLHNIYSLGFVDNIEVAISTKKYFVSPTYIGSGIRIKVLNALATGAVCFVSTLDYQMFYLLKDGINLMKYAGFEEFYRKLIQLEEDESLYNSLSLHARQVGNNYTWTNYAEKVTNEISTTPGSASW